MTTNKLYRFIIYKKQLHCFTAEEPVVDECVLKVSTIIKYAMYLSKFFI